MTKLLGAKVNSLQHARIRIDCLEQKKLELLEEIQGLRLLLKEAHYELSVHGSSKSCGDMAHKIANKLEEAGEK